MNKIGLLGVSLSVFVILFLLFFSIRNVVFDYNFYQKEHEKNLVYSELNRSEAESATANIIGYLKGREDLSNFFNSREKAHMADVKNLFDRLNFYYYLCLLLVIANIYLLSRKKDFLGNVADSFLFSTAGVMFISLIIFFFRSNFSNWFTDFHLLFFTNDLWLLNPETDKLIVLLPEQFFYDAFFQIVVRLVTSLLFLSVIALLIKFYSRKRSGSSL
ncbi:TIGR01906 family membrane protein [Candidatus Woesearchaeota archaeon]|nr:TIGR01906 family membrane protein [Candidatus Woesearchaeota archaeon]